MKRFSLFCVAGIALCAAFSCSASANIHAALEIPYSLGTKKTAATPGETVRAILSIENRGARERKIPVELKFPPGIVPVVEADHWNIRSQSEGRTIYRDVELAGGYGQWFDVLTLQVSADSAPGSRRILFKAGGEGGEAALVLVSRADGVPLKQSPVFESIVLPLDKDGRKDEKQSGAAIVLRDRSLDYYKNILRGKGASNPEIEAVHPVTHMGLDFSNPSGQQKLVLVEAELLDWNTRRHVPGLYTPGSNADNDGAGALAAKQERLTAFAALTGETRQRLHLPIYADESLIAEGKYLLRVTVEDGDAGIWSREAPVVVVKKNLRGLATLGLALLMLAVFLVLAAKRLPFVLSGMKTRRLITIALFGTCAFAVVSVPSTLLNDFFHVFLGPFSFLLTGMFSGIVLYMLTGALITLIPLHGVVSLMALIRLLLGMVAFGHVSPILLLSYGTNTFMLEAMLALSGFTSARLTDSPLAPFSLKRLSMLALACALADMVATYVTLQGMSVLYRLYFADWYIYMVLAVNGFLYTVIGAGCGLLLGSRLAEVGSD